MSESADTGLPLTHEQLPRLHMLTREVEKLCRTQLRTYVDALTPLFRPRRVLGQYMEGTGKELVNAADANLGELRETYFRACGRPFNLRKELNTPLPSFSSQVQLHPWEYSYDLRRDSDRRTITVVAPLTWVLSFSSTYTFPMLRQVVLSRGEQDADSVGTFVLRASLMHLLFQRLPEIAALFEGLRYKVEMRRSAQLGELPLVTVSAPIVTVRPPDDLLLRATELSGRAEFVEVIDPDQAAHLPDPLQAGVLRILDSVNDPAHPLAAGS